ncbi:MAG: M23 family metallopeptidase [Polaribacter sp.]|uniref:M23 family metallopeptidase n=1 Tax=Polaribacter sp. TaxID=1920175 RepID=UPI002F3510A5
MLFRILILCFLFISCSKKPTYKIPSHISFKFEKDSTYVILKNNVLSTSFLKIENLIDKKTTYIDFKKPDILTVLKFHQLENDSLSILKNYRFYFNYGNSFTKNYDTLHNYGLPFLKEKKHKILQGNNGNFSHNKPTSKYAIDFKMNIGQKICAIREGIVVNVKSNSNEGGGGEEYFKKANIIFIFHADGTFSQYGHLKKDGVLVKVGDTVKKGQVIGYSGNTGMSTEPHLHLVVYKSTKNGLISIPYILDSIPTEKYKRGKYAINN